MQSIFKFLKQLADNNNRDWFEANKARYLKAKEEYEQFADGLIKGIIKFDKKIDPSLTGKQCTFRIYKDVRFSKDKSPYKTNMGASINPGGKKSPEAGYYIHCEPGNCFLAGGVWMPMPDVIQAIRQEIDYNPKPLLKILNSPSFKKYFKGLEEEDKLKTAPKGFDKEHPLIDILRNRHFLVLHKLKDSQMSDSKIILDGFKAMYPLMEYLRAASAK